MCYNPRCQGSAETWPVEELGSYRRSRDSVPTARPDTLYTIHAFLSHRLFREHQPLSSRLLSAEVCEGDWVRCELVPLKDANRIKGSEPGPCKTQMWFGSRWEALYAIIFWNRLHLLPHTGGYLHTDRSEAERDDMTWVELQGDGWCFAIMFEVLGSSNFVPGPELRYLPTQDDKFYEGGDYCIIALWVCSRHVSELHPRRSTIGLPWNPDREVGPVFAHCLDMFGL